MSIEIPNVAPVETKERKIYPERGLFSIDESIERLRKIKNGEIKPIALEQHERQEILFVENELGAELEEIFRLKTKIATFHPEYLLTKEGGELFASSMEIAIEGEDENQIAQFIYRNRELIGSSSGVKLKEVEAKSKKYTEDKLIEGLSVTMSEFGEINIGSELVSQPINVVLNPEVTLKKIEKLREFKFKLKEIARSNELDDKSTEYKTVFEDVLDQYRQRVNELIIAQFGHAVKIKLLAERIGQENLSVDENKLITQFSGLEKFVSIYSRFDKFEFGIDGGVNGDGNYKQVAERMRQYVEEMEKKYIENERSKRKKAAEKGLDLSKINEEDIPKEIFSKYAEEFLDFYGQKSSQPSEQFDPNREGTAPDGKWQFAPSFKYSSMDVDFKQRVIKAPAKNRSLVGLVPVLLGHEFTHVKQGINQEKIALRLFNEVCGNRRLILAEGAAMAVQNQISEELFGFSELPKPYYIKAMLKKIAGGNFLDCVEEYYSSSLNVYLETSESFEKDKLKKKAKALLGVAVRSCKRLFKPGEELNSKIAALSKSKDTVYMEQYMVMEKLREAGLEKFAMVRGINLDSLFILLKDGFIREDDIEDPDLDFVRDKWEELKPGYVLE